MTVALESRWGAYADAAVNVVPLAILVLFMASFLVVDPWAPDPRSAVISLGLLLVPSVLLLLVTIVAARKIQASSGDR